jgi:peroxiredoxin
VPEIVLTTARGDRAPLASFHAAQSVVLAFHCGVGCVACAVHLFKLTRLLYGRDDLTGLAVGGDDAEEVAMLLQHYEPMGHGTVLVALADPDRSAAASFGLCAPGEPGRPAPATFVIDRRGIVAGAVIDVGHALRPPLDALRPALAAGTGKPGVR